MSNFWKAPTATINAIRVEAMTDLDYPNGRADEPFAEGGDFSRDGVAYVSCQCPNLYAEEYPDLEAISKEEYINAQPKPEELE